MPSPERELERVEGGFGITPKHHFFQLRSMIPNLKGLAILDNDGRDRKSVTQGGLIVMYWRRYEAENYFITPALLRKYAIKAYSDAKLFGSFKREIDDVLAGLITESVFAGSREQYEFQNAPEAAARLVWDASTERLKLSLLAKSSS